MLNGKYGGDLDKIQVTGNYMIEVWRACGMKIDEVELLWASEEINRNPQDYWMGVMKIARNKSIKRLERCSSIMGRGSEDRKASKILYPLMQCNDVFFLNCDILQLGIDQRKVNMLARETASLFDRKKPVILSHHILKGLKQGQEKMSKSDPSSSIYMTDTAKQVERKIRKAYCMPGDVDQNPIIDYAEHLIMPYLKREGRAFTVEIGEGKIHYYDPKELVSDFMNKLIHPAQLKRSVIAHLNEILHPIREYFSLNERASSLFEQVKSFT
jgi:tyrosyl-tRNA synthetase